MNNQNGEAYTTKSSDVKEKQTISTDEVGTVEEVLNPIIVDAMKHDPQFDNIQPIRCLIALKMSGLFTIHSSALLHYLHGLQGLIHSQLYKHDDERTILLLNMIGIISEYGVDPRQKTITLDFKQVTLLKEALEFKLKHCEENKDDKSFNKDSYINMKYLLLDLRLWLAGEILSYD